MLHLCVEGGWGAKELNTGEGSVVVFYLFLFIFYFELFKTKNTTHIWIVLGELYTDTTRYALRTSNGVTRTPVGTRPYPFSSARCRPKSAHFVFAGALMSGSDVFGRRWGVPRCSKTRR
jgi:hypothetical protein